MACKRRIRKLISSLPFLFFFFGTYRNSVLLVGREEFVNGLEFHVIVELALVQLTPDCALQLGIGQLGPVEALQRIRWLWHVLLWQLHFGWCGSC